MRRRLLIGSIAAATVIFWIWAAVALRASWGVIERVRSRGLLLPRFRPHPQSTIVYDRRESPAFTYFVEQRTRCRSISVSTHMLDAIVAVEDRRFYQHFGIDRFASSGAAVPESPRRPDLEGGSTITQQLARAAQLSPVRTYERKIREANPCPAGSRNAIRSGRFSARPEHGLLRRGLLRRRGRVRGYFGKAAADLDPPRRRCWRRSCARRPRRTVRVARACDRRGAIWC